MTLILDRIDCYYGDVRVLKDVSLSLPSGEVLCVLGRNGAGKTTLLRAILGLVNAASGRITLGERELSRLRPDEVARAGIAYVPQGRRLFPFFTVKENLTMGLLLGGRGDETLGWVLGLFPALGERLGQRAGTLSGGEQQMLAVARALCAAPRLLLMDEPSEGLMPAVVERLLDTIRALKSRHMGVLLVEQKIDAALQVADRVVLMEDGQIAYRSTPEELAANPELLTRYLGVRRSPGG